MAKFLVTVVDKSVRYFYKEVEADNQDAVKEIVEQQYWSPEEGWWEDLEAERITENYIDSIREV